MRDATGWPVKAGIKGAGGRGWAKAEVEGKKNTPREDVKPTSHQRQLAPWGGPSSSKTSGAEHAKMIKAHPKDECKRSVSATKPVGPNEITKVSSSASNNKRKDAPVIYNHRRGDRKKAMQAATDDSTFEEARKAYEKDWVSSGDTRDFYFITWKMLHEAHWDGYRRPALTVFPLCPERIHTMGYQELHHCVEEEAHGNG